ncbi:MAG: hypothetical protein R3D57_17410 [Hyphomicrobiaceae bacterium]
MAFFARRPTLAPEARTAPQQHVGADPLSIALTALGALGTVASLASMAWLGTEVAKSAGRPTRKSSLILRDLESDCLMLLEALRRLNRSLRQNGGAKTLASTPFKFGLLGTPAERDALLLYRQTLSEVARIAAAAHANVLEVSGAIQHGAIDAPEDAFYGFGECQERLNGLLAERRGLSAVVDGAVAVADALRQHVAGLKAHARS